MEITPIVTLVSASTALVASIIGPIVTLTVARRQYNATVISTSRQKWIEALRDTLAELISLISTALVVKSKWKGDWDRGRGPLNADPAMLKMFEHMFSRNRRSTCSSIRRMQIIDFSTRRLKPRSRGCAPRNRWSRRPRATSETSRVWVRRSSDARGSA